MCRKNMGWDDPIPLAFSQQWTEWLTDLERVVEFKVDRCMKPKDFNGLTCTQLHHFADTSQHGYGTVSYLKLENQDRRIHLTFMLGKARVAPLGKARVAPSLWLHQRDLMTNVVTHSECATSRLIHYFSDWTKLKISVAWFLRLRTALPELSRKRKGIKASLAIGRSVPQSAKVEEQMRKAGAQSLSASDLSRAKYAIISFSQSDRFKEEISCLESGSVVKRTRSLYKSVPVFS